MKQIIILTLLLALPFVALRAQTEDDMKRLSACKEEVRAMNSQTLYKKQRIWGTAAENKVNLTVVDYKTIVEGVMIYYDSKGKIRKYIETFNYPESYGFSIHYFDEEGYAVHSVFNDPLGVTGNRFMKKNKLVYLNIETRDENYEIEETIEQYGGESSFTATKYPHTDSIPKHLANDPLLSFDAKTATRVTFSPPKANDKTVTNVRRANLRKNPSTAAEIITVVALGDIVQILERANEEWYKITVGGQTGYIFGELIELVERDVTN